MSVQEIVDEIKALKVRLSQGQLTRQEFLDQTTALLALYDSLMVRLVPVAVA